MVYTWWLIPLSKWVITPVINGISRVNPLIIGVITHLLSGMSHQVPPMKLVIWGMMYGAGFTTMIFALFFSMGNQPWESIERRCPISGDPVLGMTFRGILDRLGHLRSSCNRNPRGATSVLVGVSENRTSYTP